MVTGTSEHAHAGYVREHMWRNPFTGKGFSLRPEIAKDRMEWGRKLSEAENHQEYQNILQEINTTFLGKTITFTQEFEWKMVAKAFLNHPVFDINVLVWLPWKLLDMIAERHMSADELIDVITPFYHYVQHFLDSQKPLEKRTFPSDCDFAMLPRIKEVELAPARLREMAIITAHIEFEMAKTVRRPELLQETIPAFVTGYHYVEPPVEESPVTTESATTQQIQSTGQDNLTTTYETFQYHLTAVASNVIESAVLATKDAILKAALEKQPDITLQLNNTQTQLLEAWQRIEELEAQQQADAITITTLQGKISMLASELDSEAKRANNLQATIDEVKAHADIMREMAARFQAIGKPKSPETFAAQQEILTAAM